MKRKEARTFPGLSVRGIKTAAAGALTISAGLGLLVFCDEGGKNWAATISPFLVLGGYALVFLGIILDEAKDHQGI